MDSSLNEEINEGGSLLNQAKGSESFASNRVLIPLQLHLVFISIEVVDGISDTIERFHLWHSEFYWKREVEHLGYER